MDEKTHVEDTVAVERVPAPVTAKPKIIGQNLVFILAIGMAMIVGGAINGMIATTLAQPSFNAYFGLTAGNSTSLIGATNGTFYAGGFCGVFFGAWLADKFGRKRALALNCILSIVWLALLAGSVKMAMFITFRFVHSFVDAVELKQN